LRYSLINRFFAAILVLVSGQIVFAPISGASSAVYACKLNNSACDLYFSTFADFKLRDSLKLVDQVNNDYIKNRSTKLETTINRFDTIQKSFYGNVEPQNKNSLSTLKSRGENNFITRNLFSLIIKDNQPPKGQMNVNSTLYFAPFAGKRIGKIRFLQLDVFGTSLQDTMRRATGWIEKTGNTIHKKTTEQKLRMQLIFNPGEKVDPQLMAENEKIIRDLPYIQDVAIILSNSEGETGVVDVLVIIKEKFEYAINGNLSPNSWELEVIDQNLFGIGDKFSASMEYDQSENPICGGSFNYEISDLGGKFIRTGFGYTNTYREAGWNTYLDKKFIASKVDWAGGISLERVFSDNYLTPYSYTRLDTAASYINSDIWYGRQIKIRNNYSSLGNIILAGRYLHQNYYNNPSEHSINSLFRNHDFILGSIGISKRYLYKDNQVYGYGITEDIPYGRYAELVTGLDIDANRTRSYLQFSYSKANILKGGSYFKWQIGMGGFISGSQVEQGTILVSTNYFTHYVYLNRHPYRFFVNMELLSGINRFKEEYLVINRGFGIRDYFSLDTKGTNRLKINIESVRFLSANKSGFRFANYFFADAAFLSNNLKTILNDQFFGGIGLGIRVHNESLVFNVLEVRLSWIPIAPKNNNPFVFNAFGQPKARFDDFLGGKPQQIPYQ
jgi:hypothetical protein